MDTPFPIGQTTRDLSRRTVLQGLAATAVLPALPAVRPALAAAVAKDTPRYDLRPRQIADGTYVFIGSTNHFHITNGGDIVNSAFVVTSDGVVVIDTGTSLAYGQQMRALINEVSGNKPILKTINTHRHPDHFFGNQAFTDAPIAALPKTREIIEEEGEMLAEGLYGILLHWMKGTEVVIPTEAIDYGTIKAGDHEFDLLPLQGHSESDLALFDKKTGVFFVQDLVFNGRTPTTPHCTIPDWHKSLDIIEKRDFKILVPGHGQVVTDRTPIAETRAYITWIDQALREAVKSGLDMMEASRLEIPPRFASMTVAREEYLRSVSNLYPDLEAELLPLLK